MTTCVTFFSNDASFPSWQLTLGDGPMGERESGEIKKYWLYLLEFCLGNFLPLDASCKLQAGTLLYVVMYICT